MKLILGAVIATTSIIILGVLIISPVFFPIEKPTPVMLSFNINDHPNLDNWCKEVSSLLQSKNIRGTVFISGKLAENYPSCITSFPKNFDVGSQTYSYTQLTEISDYSIQLEEVKQGREVINKIGNLDSKLFKAPYGETDDDIYSLLSRNEILADFSYQNQFHKYHENQFLKFDLVTYDSQNVNYSLLQNIESSDYPIQIEFNSFMSSNEIQETISVIETAEIEFVNASDISQMELTRRN